jgi:hypothetical protein
MAIPMVKSTYVLDVETAQSLERLAKDWRVSKSEALRRVIRSAAAPPAPDRVAVLRQLQKAVALGRVEAAAWESRQRAERRATGGRAVVGRGRR